ncbi:hypothetical protein DEU56DRAFT_959595 [Suillus clintonianus]|uniref:uncharacterized protein n=1 Tax=Suillus clintonianus TaxID=1904413 RepID=UPI001B883C79|nr:uncharacterized protein DEU56DRAFT_959595 [Suillus clintonianus]KAG2126266.1 hypothetical protein DEU56DRAFT_959595 [Suillus clintonianus]
MLVLEPVHIGDDTVPARYINISTQWWDAISYPPVTLFTTSKPTRSFTIPFKLACHPAIIQVPVSPPGVNEVQKKELWQRPAPENPTVMKKTTAQRKAHVSVTKHGRHDGGVAQVTSSRPDTPDEILGLAAKKCRVVGETSKGKANTKKRRVTEPYADSDIDVDIDEGLMSAVKHTQKKGKEKELWSHTSQPIDNEFSSDEPVDEISDSRPSHNDSEKDSEEEEIEDDLEEPKSLSAETPVFVSRSKAEQTDLPLTQPTWPRTTTSKELMRAAQLFPFPSAQPRATKTPVWADTQVVVSDEEHEPIMVLDDSEEDNPDHSRRPTLVWTDTDIDTRRVVQRAILEAKVHLTFVNGYPELTEKSLFTRDALLTAARACSVLPIKDRLKSDDSYVTALATLIEARVPLFRTELKDDACAQVTSYYRLGPDCVDTVKALLVNHVYHYEQHFNEKNDPIPQPKKPYFADILPYLMKGRYFNGLKSVGMKFSDRFKEIAQNKAQRPEVTIPMVALTSTSVYAALFWKANGSPSKFNFTGNLFSEVYFFHVKFLEDMKVTAPRKFHKMMADIFEAIQKLCTHGNNALVGSHESAMAFLDIAGMDDEE